MRFPRQCHSSNVQGKQEGMDPYAATGTFSVVCKESTGKGGYYDPLYNLMTARKPSRKRCQEHPAVPGRNLAPVSVNRIEERSRQGQST